MFRNPLQATMWLVAATALLFTACGAPQQAAQRDRPNTSDGQTNRPKSIVLGISNDVAVMPPLGSNTTSGGWQSVNELYAQGLVTSDRDVRRPIPRLASQIPSFDAGTIEILADGRMRTTYPLRTDVTWHDGQPFTSKDLMFSFELAKDPIVPHLSAEAINVMDTAEAPDDHTFVIYWKNPYYLADSVGLRAFWPLPRHLLETSYRTLDPIAFTNLPYWTSQYVSLGPFRLEEFKPGQEITFEAYDGYFLGRPKLDRVIVRGFNDENVLYSALLGGGVDMVMDNSLAPDTGLELKDTWDASGAGTVYLGTGTTRFLAPQFDPSVQVTPAILDPQFRQAIMYALDRPSLSEVIQHGHREFVANSLLPPGDRLYDAVKDGFARYTHDPTRARSILMQLGYRPGPDQMMVAPSGERLTTVVWTTEGGDREIALVADYLKQIGIASDQYVVPGARVRDREYRAAYPAMETSAAGSGDAILNRVDSRQSAVPPSFSGTNRGHYANPQLDVLIDRYRSSIAHQDQEQAAKAISDLMADDLGVLPLYFNPTTPAVRKGVKAFEDFHGGADGSGLYGTFSRNAHEWDLQ